jgi:hypothetical protein
MADVALVETLAYGLCGVDNDAGVVSVSHKKVANATPQIVFHLTSPLHSK